MQKQTSSKEKLAEFVEKFAYQILMLCDEYFFDGWDKIQENFDWTQNDWSIVKYYNITILNTLEVWSLRHEESTLASGIFPFLSNFSDTI